MKILYISHSDLLGRQFNGYTMMPELRKLGHETFLAVDIQKDRENPFVHKISTPKMGTINRYLSKLERKIGIRNILPIQSSELFRHEWYLKADIVHLQLVHATQYFSLLNLIRMSNEKKIVWTIHDPWITTGHCIYPLDCTGWLNKCQKCPYLELPFPIPRDTAWINWQLKRNILARTRDIHLIVASDYMKNIVKMSPITAKMPIALIPFGIDTNIYYPRRKEAARRKLGLPLDAIIISFRSVPDSPYKGLNYIEDALSKISNETYIIITTLDGVGDLKKISDRFPILEFGWIYDDEKKAALLAASDIFLMPSPAEAFGLMAIEAMACGTPTVVFDGTSLPEVVGDAGIVVPMNNSDALADAIKHLLTDKGLRDRTAENGVRRVQEKFTIKQYVESHLALYNEILSR